MPSMPLRRKKWTEEEEETLISKYGELLQSGFLSKTKSRERKFEPIAAHVNALFHAQNPVAYPWLWSWKDASTKVQNMRHQYLGVKQKIRKMVPSSIDPAGEHEEFEWRDGLSLWPNFLKYKAVFGDQELDVNEFFTHPPANPRVLPLRHHRSRPLLSPSSHGQTHSTTPPFQPVSSNIPHSLMHSSSSGFPNAANNGTAHSLSKDFIDNGTALANTNGSSFLGCVKDAAAVSVDQVVLDGDPGSLGLNYEYDAEGDEHGMKDACDEYEDDDDGTLDYTRQKRRRHWGRLETGLDGSANESQLLSFIAGQFAELREREAKREEREIEREKEREKKWALLNAETDKQKQEWEREKREMEQAKREEVERQDVAIQERELKRSMMEQQWREIERERDREREEKMERDKMEWREKMENQAKQHQAAMMQIQLQIAQCLQSSVAMLSGAVSQIAGQANDVNGSAGPLFSQLLQNLQTHGTGLPHCGIRRATGESSDSQFDVDG